MNHRNKSSTTYDPARHHRRSIRLKTHDYAGGGVYFVTICAHRDAGDVFAAPAVRDMVGQVWVNLPASVGASLVGAPLVDAPLVGARRADSAPHEGWPYVVMPDHFHAIVRMRAGAKTLGDVVGAFKSMVVHEYIAGVRAGRFAPFPGKIWHRNYYESIVRTPEAEARIAEYIRMNPWRCAQEFGNGLRGIGNPALLGREKTAVLCSRHCPDSPLAAATRHAQSAAARHCFIGGFHSPPERALLAALLQTDARLICCPAWGIDTMRIPTAWLPALETNRMLILEMRNREGNLAAAEQRNRFVLENAGKRWIPHITPGGMLDRLVRATPVSPQQLPKPGPRVPPSSPPITPHPNPKKPS